MVDLLRHVLQSQYLAALSMLGQCVDACGEPYWEGRIVNGTFRQIVYHTLFFTDLYLSPTPEDFQLRDLHQRGGDERGPTLCAGLDREDTLAYTDICRGKVRTSIGAETEASLGAPSAWRQGLTRAELHVYNIRHIQHHTGALSAHLRRVDPALGQDGGQLKWVGQA